MKPDTTLSLFVVSQPNIHKIIEWTVLNNKQAAKTQKGEKWEIWKCIETYHGIENAELLFTEFMNFHGGHGICCEIRHDLGVGPRSIQRFTSGQIWVCWPGLVLFAIEPNILEWKVAQAAGHIAGNAVPYVFHFDIPKNKYLLFEEYLANWKNNNRLNREQNT